MRLRAIEGPSMRAFRIRRKNTQTNLNYGDRQTKNMMQPLIPPCIVIYVYENVKKKCTEDGPMGPTFQA